MLQRLMAESAGLTDRLSIRGSTRGLSVGAAMEDRVGGITASAMIAEPSIKAVYAAVLILLARQRYT